jgi:hypothetical protein
MYHKTVSFGAINYPLIGSKHLVDTSTVKKEVVGIWTKAILLKHIQFLQDASSEFACNGEVSGQKNPNTQFSAKEYKEVSKISNSYHGWLCMIKLCWLCMIKLGCEKIAAAFKV